MGSRRCGNGDMKVNSDNFPSGFKRVSGMRTIFLLTLFSSLLASQTAAAQDEGAGTTASAFMKCARIANDAQRLSCYDRLATELIELGLSNLGGPEPAPTEPPPAPVADTSGPTGDAGPPAVVTGGGAASVATNEEAFGLERVEDAQDEDIKLIQSRYVGEFTGWDGQTTFPLQNGQVWQQIESGRMAWRATDPMITIKRGFMGSYMLSVEGVNKKVRVKRIK
jgi:hypothetical protein